MHGFWGKKYILKKIDGPTSDFDSHVCRYGTGKGARIRFWVLQSKSDLQSDNEGGIKKNGPAKKNEKTHVFS